MSGPIEPHFSKVWYVSTFNVALLTLPLDLLFNWSQWTVFCWFYSVFALGFFLGPEWAAAGVRDGYSGTKTSWMFARVKETWVRVILGVWMAAIMFWRFPEGLFFDIVAWGFLLWLPFHYAKRGSEGPFWEAVIRLLERAGIAAWFKRTF